MSRPYKDDQRCVVLLVRRLTPQWIKLNRGTKPKWVARSDCGSDGKGAM